MIPKETIEKIKADAENYAGVMVWINKHPKGEEQLFYEYISATSHEAGATEWARRAKPLIDLLDEARLQIEYLHKRFEETGSGNAVLARIETELAKYKEVGK